jgi:hypothetical protein
LLHTPGTGRRGGVSGERQFGMCMKVQIVMDSGEQLKGASKCNHLDLLTEEQWQMMKPEKKG